MIEYKIGDTVLKLQNKKLYEIRYILSYYDDEKTYYISRLNTIGTEPSVAFPVDDMGDFIKSKLIDILWG